jgi:mono/diheme cytochrome c family protein
MSQHADDTHSTTDGLWRWLLGGLAGGAVILGLLVAAYAIGYQRGHHHSATSATNAPPPATTTTPTTPSAPAGIGPVTVTPALVARGKTLYTSDSCSGCHSLNGTAGAGPSFKDLAGSSTTLDNGQTVMADDAYLERSIVDPNAQIVKGFHAGLMAPAIASFDLANKPDDIRALVAYIKSQK